MRAQSVIFDDVLDQIREQQIEVAKLDDDDPLKPVLRRLFALYGEMTEKLRDGDLDANDIAKAMCSTIREILEEMPPQGVARVSPIRRTRRRVGW